MLQYLCVDAVVLHDVVYIERVGEFLPETIRKREAQLTCGNTVTRLRKLEKEREPDPFIGYTDGIQGVIQCKDYVCTNSICKLNAMKSGVYNVGNFGSTYMLYYLKQEPGFQFDIRVRRSYDRVGEKNTLFIVHEMKVL